MTIEQKLQTMLGTQLFAIATLQHELEQAHNKIKELEQKLLTFENGVKNGA